MKEENQGEGLVPTLSDKDYQLVSKTFRRVCELFYQSPANEEFIECLVCFTSLIPQIVPSKTCTNGLTIISQMQILKAKAKGIPALATKLSNAIEHMRNPKYIPINTALLIEVMGKEELHIVGCIVTLRHFSVLKQDHTLDWKVIVDLISQKIAIAPHLSIDILNQLSKNNDQNVRIIVKSGIFKYISVVYISSTIKDRFNLYKALKLIRAAASVEKTIINYTENVQASVIQTYDEYVPIMVDIFSKCYDAAYCGDWMKKNIYQDYINYAYLWSYAESFCSQQLSGSIINNYVKIMNEKEAIAVDYQSKVLAILSNYCKYCKIFSKEFLKYIPKHQQNLLNYFKLCFNLSQLDLSTPYFINWKDINNLLQANSNVKVAELAKYLQELMSKEVKVGALSSNLRKLFSSEKNADLMMERAAKRPKNNQQLEHIKQILSLKERNNQLDSDTLLMAKQKACSSLRDAVAHNIRLDLNSVLRSMQLDNVHLVANLLQVVELYLVMFEDAIETIDLQRIIEMISWIEDNYRGQIIDWGSISQILLVLCEESQWKKHLKNLSNYCFWILSIQNMTKGDEKQLWDAVKKGDAVKMNKKMPLVIGFLGKVLTNSQRAELLSNHRLQLQSLVNKLAKNDDYEIAAMMLSYYLKGWSQEQDEYDPIKHKKDFEQFISPIDKVISSHLRLIPQDYYLLESFLPYKISLDGITSELESLVHRNGKLASYVYSERMKKTKKGYQGKILSMSSQPAQNIHQSMIFAKKCPSLVKGSELKNLVSSIAEEPKSYWQLYPRYVDILGNVINVIGNSQNESIEGCLTDLSQTLINEIVINSDIADDQRQQLLQDVRDAFENMKSRGVYIEIERIKRIVNKIVEKEIREEIIVILNNYKVNEQRKIDMNIIRGNQKEEEERQDKKQKRDSKGNYSSINQKKQKDQFDKGQSTVLLISQNEEKQEAYSSVMSVQKQFQSVKATKSVTLLKVFELLKKIVQKQEEFQRFYEVEYVIMKNELNEAERELLGSLLSQMYHLRQCPKVLGLLLMKDKTIVCKQKVFELVNTHIPAFSLSRRWKLVSRQYLDIAMKRVTQGFIHEGCQVANYNLVKTADLEYFFSRKYHQIVQKLAESVTQQDQLASLLGLIGMAARFPQIRSQWVSQKFHLKILRLLKLFPKSIKVIGNLAFALSALTFEENTACVDIVKQTELIYLMLDCMLLEPTNLSIAQHGSLFIGNLSFAKSFDSCPGFDIGKVVHVLTVIFNANLQSQNLNPYKHLLKALGNLSCVTGCSSMMLVDSFCGDLVKFAERIDILSGYDEKKQKYMKLLLDLVSNLATNKDLDRLIVLHKAKITLLTITLLQTLDPAHAELIASCIDAIDAISQEKNIETWFVNEKKLPYILLDILKLQSEQKLLVKAIRMVTNLTLHEGCIQCILKSNILGVIANVVIPQLSIRSIAQESQETSKKIETYIFKIITRIYHSKPKPPLDQILKSGFLDCLVRLIEMTDVDEKILDILFHYSPHIPNFLNKRAFSSMIKILTIKVNDKEILVKCLQSLKNILSFSYDADEEDILIKGIPEMYMKFLSTQFTADALFLLAYHLLRSFKLRQLLRKPSERVQQGLRSLSKFEEYSDICKSITFLIYCQPTPLYLNDYNSKNEMQYYEIMKKGFRCKLYRTDGSFKDAILDIDQQYNFRVYKYPDGEIKWKYVVNVKHIREFQIEYQCDDELWKKTVFSADRGFFNSYVPVDKHCCTILGNSRWGEINLINIEFNSVEDKIMFFRCMSYLLAIFKL